ncbi:D-3-phosphoglycerate dehydrogenase [Alteribacillus persepolensis]|uniref:D-3-phosphoglycerate dehydrogenase n=1 Tax=Alteribacillus persepolensis TaxID=568899 RepID=A0A1G7ZK96_9BACI|nr:phosphoglycerate dehydrogenase [Alteribacillus persepolensis]SDH08976.1 D-3-phosphoglycerate dehydrogenase [Alteribacillus persepolensis]
MIQQPVAEKAEEQVLNNTFRVLVSDNMSEQGLKPLLDNDNMDCVQQNVNDTDDLDEYDALLVRSGTTVTAALMDQMSRLKIIARAGVGVDNIDIDAATKRGIVVINAPDGNTISTAEHTFAMIISLARKVPQANASIKGGEWNRKAFQGTELRGKTLGIVGFGRIGSELAKRARGFDMSTIVYDPFLTKERAEKAGVQLADLDELLPEADIITVHTPLTKETKGLLGMENIKKTKEGVFLINCARGGIIDEDALKHYLENGHVAGAALDVFEEEPAQDNELLAFDQVISTPHIAASTKEAQLNVAAQVSEEVLQFLKGMPALNSINLPAMSKEKFETLQPYYELSKKMGHILSQSMTGPVQDINVQYSGEVTELETSVLTRSLIAGFLQTRIDAPVNDVNASLIAKERGINYGEKHQTNALGYSNLIQATVEEENQTFTIHGTYVKEYGPRIVRINDFHVDFYPTGHLIYIKHTDKPGVIGKMGQLLGKHEVNIATMQVGRKEEGGDAIMMLAVDKEATEDVLNDLTSIEEITRADKIEV